jgi:hypothetical protein
MKRRLQITATALCACLVPACASVPREPIAKRPSVAPPKHAEVFAGSSPVLSAKHKPNLDKFGDVRPEATPTIVQRPTPLADVPFESPAPTPMTDEMPSEKIVADKTPPAESRNVETVVTETTPPAPTPSPRLTLPTLPIVQEKPRPEPIPDAEGIIRASWPVLKDVKPMGESSPNELVLPPPSELILPGKTDDVPKPAPVAEPKPSPLPPGVIGSSLHQTNASPVDIAPTPVITAPPTPPTMPPSKFEQMLGGPDDSSLIRAIRALQMNKPDEAIQCLKGYDPASQQVIMSLLPPLVRLSSNNLDQIKAEEFDVLLEQINRVPHLLRPRASLQANNVRLCREVHNFAHVDPFGSEHPFRPGDIVYLYMELVNFSCTANPKGGFAIVLSSGLELRDAGGKVVWKADPKDVPDAVSTPPQDYYRNFRLCVPSVPPGNYQLTIRTTDRPTGREVTKSVAMRISSR